MTETANLDRAGSAVELMSDGDGVCVIGPTSEVDAFLVSRGLVATDMKLHRLESKLAAGSAGVLQAGYEITDYLATRRRFCHRSLIELEVPREHEPSLSTSCHN